MVGTDRIDRQILTLLTKDARITNKALAEAVSLSQSACLERVRRLTERGVIRGTHADVDPRALGVGVQAIVAIQLHRHTRRAVNAFMTKVTALPEVISVYHVTGKEDYLAHVAARSMDHLRDFTLDAITTMPEVERIETHVVFETIRKFAWPDFVEDDE